MNSCFNIFHSDDDLARAPDWVLSRHQFLNRYEELETPTVTIRDRADYERWKTPGLTFDTQGYSLDGKNGWRWGEIGIWHSNYYAWRNLVDSHYDYAILCEDDVVPDVEWLAETIDQLPDDFEVFHAWPPGDQAHKFSTSLLVDDIVSHVYQDWSMLCYVITRRAAQKAITRTKNINQPIDWWFFRNPRSFRQYTVRPGASHFRHSGLPSTFQLKQPREILPL